MLNRNYYIAQLYKVDSAAASTQRPSQCSTPTTALSRATADLDTHSSR